MMAGFDSLSYLSAEVWILAVSFFVSILVLSITQSTAALRPKAISPLEKPSSETVRPDNGQIGSTARRWVFRVNNVPSGSSPDSLLEDLRSVARSDNDVLEALARTRKVTLTRSGQETFCATVQIETTMPVELVTSKLAGLDVSSRLEYDYTFYNITPLYENPRFQHEPVDVDLVAVSGLASHAIGSWTNKNGRCWLRDFVPEDFPNARVLLYGYDSRLVGSESNQAVAHMGARLLNQLVAFRTYTNTNHRPIIFLGHSLGGLLIKEALYQAHRNHDQDEAVKAVAQGCHSMLMFGVPNRGLRNPELLAITKEKANGYLIRDLILQEDGEPPTALRNLCRFFSDRCYDRYKVLCFCEKQRTPTTRQRPEDQGLDRGGDPVIMVTEDSATGVGDSDRPMQKQANFYFNLNHIELVKYPSRSDGDYPVVRQELHKLIKEAKNHRFDFYNSGDKALFEELEQGICLPKHEERQKKIEEIKDDRIWLLENQIYKDWRSAVSQYGGTFTGLLTLKGHPGAGKSALINKLVSDHLAMTAEKNPPVIVSHFFYQMDECADASTPYSFYLHLFWQLMARVRHRPRDKIKVWADKLRVKKPTDVFSKQDLKQEILSLLVENSRAESSSDRHASFCLYIDALDECVELESEADHVAGLRDVLEFLDELLKLRSSSKVDIRICVSRRPDPTIGRLEPEGPSILMNEDPEYLKNVNLFIRNRLTGLESNAGDPYFKRRLLARIESHCTNGFLWASIVTQHILYESESQTDEALLEMVEELPKDLEPMYERMLDLVLERWGYEASAQLRLVLFAQRSLEPDQIRAAWFILAMMDKRINGPRAGKSSAVLPAEGEAWVARMRRVSGGLLEVKALPKPPESIDDLFAPQPSLQERFLTDRMQEPAGKLYVQFVHSTVVEFLQKSQVKLRRGDQYILDEEGDPKEEVSSHLVLAKACLWSLDWAYYGAPSGASSSSIRNSHGAGGFLDYACEFWLYHIQRSSRLMDDIAELPAFVTHCGPDTTDLVGKQSQLLTKSSALEGTLIGDDKHILVILAVFGCTTLLGKHLRECAKCKKLSHLAEQLKVAREVSIAAGHTDTALYLVGCLGQSVNRGSSEFQAEVDLLLYKACYHNKQDLVRGLHGQGADATAPYQRRGYGYPLLAATTLRNEKMVKLLLDLYEDRVADLLAQQTPGSQETALHILIRKKREQGGRYRILSCIAHAASAKGVRLPQLCDYTGQTSLELAVEVQGDIEDDMRECEGDESELQGLREELDEIKLIQALLQESDKE